MCNLLRQVRIDKGITQREMAKRLGFPYTQDILCRMENLGRRIDPCEFLDICKALEVDYSTILKQVDEFSMAKKT